MWTESVQIMNYKCLTGSVVTGRRGGGLVDLSLEYWKAFE